MPVLATFFSVRRGRDPFFKFFMHKLFPRQVKRYEEEFGMRFLGWYNVAYGWDFDNVILLELPDYATLDKLEADEAPARHRPSGRRMDVRATPLDVPARADGTRPRIPSLTRRPCATEHDEHPTDAPLPGDEPNGRRTMDTGRNDLLGEIAADAALERSDFLVQSTDQLHRFLDRHKERIAAYGGLTLIDEEPDYLSIAPDGTFRSRSRYQDDVTGEWVSETEVIESAAELVELYNPADIYAAFAEAAREAAGLPSPPTGSDDLLDAAGISPEETIVAR